MGMEQRMAGREGATSLTFTEVLARFGPPAQKEKYLVSLLKGETRSSFSMTEFGSECGAMDRTASRDRGSGVV
jgi:alkylation response protein AidB-like acyl-CoA dehydrogenase